MSKPKGWRSQSVSNPGVLLGTAVGVTVGVSVGASIGCAGGDAVGMAGPRGASGAGSARRCQPIEQ